MLYFIFTWQKKIKIYIYYIYFEVYTKIRFVHVPCTAPPIFVLTVPLIILGPYLKEKCRNYTHLGGLFQYCNCQAPLISLSSGCRKLVTVTDSLLCPSGAHWSVGLWRERQLTEAEPAVGPSIWVDPDHVVGIFSEPGPAL